jgi:very-long-chain enoyl-CoA reductase
MEEYFTSPDLNNPLDQSVVALTVFFTLFGGLGNVLNIPFFTRDGGLLTYSKFAKGVVLGPTVPSRVGMTLVYAPACYFGVSALGKMSSQTLWTHRTALTSAMMVAHFGKRTLECLFLHSYSGGMPLASSLFISFFYSILSVSNSHYAAFSPPLTGFPSVGFALFLVGTLGNLYHHVLLANLRKPGETGYKVPRGGWFEYVAAPHYFFELMGHLGVAMTTQHFVSLGMFTGMAAYLVERSMAQSAWNRKKIEDYPRDRKNIVPMLF